MNVNDKLSYFPGKLRNKYNLRSYAEKAIKTYLAKIPNFEFFEKVSG